MRLGHRVHTAASAAQVWELLGNPQRWPQFDVAVRRVRGSHGQAVTGQRLVGIARPVALGIPIDVLEATEPSRLVLLVHTLPGLRQRITHQVTPVARGGCDITVSVVGEGPLARPAVGWVFLGVGLTARLLAHRADRLARAARRAA